MKVRKIVKGKEKIDWKKELRSTWVLSEIESYFDTYWDSEYILFKIKRAIDKYHKREVEETMDNWRIE